MDIKIMARGIGYLPIAGALLAAANCVEQSAISDRGSLED